MVSLYMNGRLKKLGRQEGCCCGSNRQNRPIVRVQGAPKPYSIAPSSPGYSCRVFKRIGRLRIIFQHLLDGTGMIGSMKMAYQPESHVNSRTDPRTRHNIAIDHIADMVQYGRFVACS